MRKKTNLALEKNLYFTEFVLVIESTSSIHFVFKAAEATCPAKVKALLWFSKKGQKGTIYIWLVSYISSPQTQRRKKPCCQRNI